MIEHLIGRIVFKGLGAYAFVIPFGCFILFQLVVGMAFDNAFVYAHAGEVNGLALLFAGLVLIRLGAWLTRNRPGQRHTMLAIPVRQWGYIDAVLGVALWVSSVIR